LRRIGEIVAFAASEVGATVKHKAVSLTPWTTEPLALATEMLFGPLERNPIFNLFPFARPVTGIVVQRNPVPSGFKPDGAGRSPAARPVQASRITGFQKVVAFQIPQIDAPHLLAGLFAAYSPVIA
jgi:hypothetical protein